MSYLWICSSVYFGDMWSGCGKLCPNNISVTVGRETWERCTRPNKCGWQISTVPIFNAAPQTLWPRVINRSVAAPFLKSRPPCQDFLLYGVTVKSTGWLWSSWINGQSQPAWQTTLPFPRAHSIHEWASVFSKTGWQVSPQVPVVLPGTHTSLVLVRHPLCLYSIGRKCTKNVCLVMVVKYISECRGKNMH